jgi:hypothetical protein
MWLIPHDLLLFFPGLCTPNKDQDRNSYRWQQSMGGIFILSRMTKIKIIGMGSKKTYNQSTPQRGIQTTVEASDSQSFDFVRGEGKVKSAMDRTNE